MDSDEEIITRAARSALNSKPDQSLRSSKGIDIKGLHVFDGGDDWMEVNLEAGVEWICPVGVYEVYARNYDIDSFLLNDWLLSNNTLPADMWHPSFPAFAVLSFKYDDTTDPPNKFWTSDAVQTRFVTCPNGWTLTSGDVLKQETGGDVWTVRFRRIG